MDYLVHAANVLYLFSYLVKDILWLRVLTVVAAGSLLPYFYFRAEPMMAPIYWNAFFIAINIYHIQRLLFERRPVRLALEEQELYQQRFRPLTPREFVKLVGAGRWTRYGSGEELVAERSEPDRVLVIASGRAVVSRAGREVAALGPGSFVGEMSFITGEPASASVAAAEPLRVVEWSAASLRRVLDKNPSVQSAMQLIFGTDLAGKLRK